MHKRSVYITASVLAGIAIIMGCSPAITVLRPDEMRAPRPIYDNTGKYLCPYTSDGTVAEWVDKGLNARLGSSIGGFAGKQAGKKAASALETLPGIGSWLGQKAGEATGRRVAITMCGGMDAMRATSDLSFNSVDDLAVWLYVNHSTEEGYSGVLSLASEIYPGLRNDYLKALKKASKEQQS
jgi:hypothetical protein